MRHLNHWMSAVVLAGALASGTGCQTYRDQLERADEHYRAARYEAALSNLEDLEPDLGRFDTTEQVRYDYIRGMTHARLSQRAEARHWLAMAREQMEHEAAALTDDMRALLARTLTEVDWVNNPAHGDPATPSAGTAGSTGTPGTPAPSAGSGVGNGVAGGSEPAPGSAPR